MLNNCPECYNCKTYTYRELDDLLYSIRTSMAELGYADVLNKKFGYNLGGKFKFSFPKLKVLTQALKRHMWLLYNEEEPCLCDREVQQLVERVKEVVDYVCEDGCREDLYIEENPYPVLSNPECHYYEDWEKLLYKKCPTITFSETFKETCQFTFDLIKTTKCNTLEIVETLEQKCALTIQDQVFRDRCKILYDNLDNDGIGISYDEYLKAKCYETTLVEQIQNCSLCNGDC